MMDALQSFQVKNTDLGVMSDLRIVRGVLGKPGGPIEFWTVRSNVTSGPEEEVLLLDWIKREKGVWWMPWQ